MTFDVPSLGTHSSIHAGPYSMHISVAGRRQGDTFPSRIHEHYFHRLDLPEDDAGGIFLDRHSSVGMFVHDSSGAMFPVGIRAVHPGSLRAWIMRRGGCWHPCLFR